MPDNISGSHQAVPGSGNPGIDTWFDSTLDSVDIGENHVREAGERLGMDEDSLFDLGLAVREAMVNAVMHGNRYSPDKKVHFKLDMGEDSLRISIRDFGDGFDPNRVADPLAAENLMKHSGRGLLIIQSYVDEFEVKPAQPKGTEVTLVKYVNRA